MENVMASRGSVIPLFLKQIKEGKNDYYYGSQYDSIFLMSLDEAAVILFVEHGNWVILFVTKFPLNDWRFRLKLLKNCTVIMKKIIKIMSW
jgi:hypothetical protein